MRRRFHVFLTALRFSATGAAVVLAALSASACAQTGGSAGLVAETPRLYDVVFRVALKPGDSVADVSIEIDQREGLARELRLTLDGKRFDGFAGDGGIDVQPDSVTWSVPPDGGDLRFKATIPSKRESGAYDAYVAGDWALFRAFDVIPPIATRTLVGARSRSRWVFDVDEDASVTTAYPPSGDGGFDVDSPDRRFSRPSGWVLVGEFGERIDTVGAVRVVVAGPRHNKVRRLDILAFLHWNLPEVVKLFPDYPSRLFVVSANDPLWRGGLSGPASVYLHAERPLISENGTSTLLHEVLHTAMRLSSPTDDWIVEALAEYYSIELMRRSGTLSDKRAVKAFASLKKWGNSAKGLAAKSSSGARTARGVTLLAKLNAEIGKATRGTRSLDDVARELVGGDGTVDLNRLRAAAEAVAGRPVKALEKVP